MTEVAMASYRNSEAVMALAERAMFQSASNAQQLVFTNEYLATIADFLGINEKEQTKKIRLFCTPNKKALPEMLASSEAEVKTYALANNERTLKQDMLVLMHSAAVIRAAFWQSFDKSGDIPSQFKEVINRHIQDQNEATREQEGDFNAFLEKVEQGFTQESGISDTINPWGMPYPKRPKIKEIGNNQGNQDGN